MRVLSFGAGVQSTTVLMLSIVGELPRFDAVVFADTKRERRATYETLRWATEKCEQAGIPLLVTDDGGDIFDVWYQMPVFTTLDGQVGMAKRNCTSDFKVRAVRRVVRRLWVDAGRPRGLWQADGISLDEYHRASETGVRYIRAWHPLLDDPDGQPHVAMSRGDCEQWLEDHGFPVPIKSGCVCCPFQDDHSWAELRDAEPDTFAEVAALDKHMREGAGPERAGFAAAVYLHRSGRPLATVPLPPPRPKGARSLALTLGYGCRGGCGL
jgi:hypothetical protein